MSQEENDKPHEINPLLACDIKPDIRPFEWPKRKRRKPLRRRPMQLKLFDEGNLMNGEQRVAQIDALMDCVTELLDVLCKYGYCDKDTLSNGSVEYLLRTGPPPDEHDFFSEAESLSEDDFFSECETMAPMPNVIPFDPNYGKQAEPGQPMLIGGGLKEHRKPLVGQPPIPDAYKTMMYRACYATDSVQAIDSLNKDIHGRVSITLKKLMDAGADLQWLHVFKDYWDTTWWSKNKQGGYEYPRPEQVQEHWWKFTAWLKAKWEEDTKQAQTQIRLAEKPVDIIAMMQNKAHDRRPHA
jgi:hypothetical protein